MKLSVRLINASLDPLETVAATARTCYSSKGIVFPQDIKDKIKRDRLVRDLFRAGHHTTFQHIYFQFAIAGVSRLFIWSFLHNHPFYNSEQVSQRYVEIKKDNFYIPPLEGKAMNIYTETIEYLLNAYRKLQNLLHPVIENFYFKRFPSRKREDKRWQREVKRKVLEFARYVLPLSTQAYLYHTINAVTLMRYYKLMGKQDVPQEEKEVVGLMVNEVTRWEPEFGNFLNSFMKEERDMPEWTHILKRDDKNARILKKQFDRELDGKFSKLVSYKDNNEELISRSVHEILGVPYGTFSTEDAISLVMDPARNRSLSGSLNVTYMEKLSRALLHASYTFIKKLSHTADSQNQRHRTSHATRPFIIFYLSDEPDYITPPIFMENKKLLNFYRMTMESLWERINKLKKLGWKKYSIYLLPNAFALRIRESSDLLSLTHKYRMRLCLNAQEEIWRLTVDEVKEIEKINPIIAKYLLPPCAVRYLSHKTPYCPEGSRYCGVPVWNMKVTEIKRKI